MACRTQASCLFQHCSSGHSNWKLSTLAQGTPGGGTPGGTTPRRYDSASKLAHHLDFEARASEGNPSLMTVSTGGAGLHNGSL